MEERVMKLEKHLLNKDCNIYDFKSKRGYNLSHLLKKGVIYFITKKTDDYVLAECVTTPIPTQVYESVPGITFSTGEYANMPNEIKITNPERKGGEDTYEKGDYIWVNHEKAGWGKIIENKFTIRNSSTFFKKLEKYILKGMYIEDSYFLKNKFNILKRNLPVMIYSSPDFEFLYRNSKGVGFNLPVPKKGLEKNETIDFLEKIFNYKNLDDLLLTCFEFSPVKYLSEYHNPTLNVDFDIRFLNRNPYLDFRCELKIGNLQFKISCEKYSDRTELNKILEKYIYDNYEYLLKYPLDYYEHEYFLQPENKEKIKEKLQLLIKSFLYSKNIEINEIIQ